MTHLSRVVERLAAFDILAIESADSYSSCSHRCYCLGYYVLSNQQVFRIKAMALTKVSSWLICISLVQAAGDLLVSNADIAIDDPLKRIGQQVYMARGSNST
ncbi:hypothetical protein Cob_v009075 [Colletotrichum orbiculare MAFF 240422]|uniref:Uncharacterized protein n=1 Tax=Colletotrichum orbiculare (strain 104-T / ATCC 96160 / CBS 514.97 / LARS 414 / MAFF 240422) TaxID=1213857 RepID=A0A484FKM7_COLOR|nr:hypothetical protein Cob_v009075 [Colletotrichum orbiculare MAFF 240422]